MNLNHNNPTLGGFLGGSYYIPSYQREYSWEEPQLEDFWRDIEFVIKQKDSSHFLGQIVINNNLEDNKKYIIDGQQRTITSMIFMKTLQILYLELNDIDKNLEAYVDAATILKSYLGKTDPHLHLNDIDDPYFQNAILAGKPQKEKTKETRERKSFERMRFAYNYFYEKFTSDKGILSNLNLPSEKKDILDLIYNTFTERFTLLTVETSSFDEAFIIFETLNARGKSLETADLLKNHLFQKANEGDKKKSKENIDAAESKWNKMTENLGRIDTTKYIRAYWNSCHEFTRDKALYRTISKAIDTPSKSRDFLNKLLEYSSKFHDILIPKEATDISDEALLSCLQSLQVLKVKTFYPLLLSLFEKGYSTGDITKVVEVVECYYFRNFTICRNNPNTNETFLTDIATKISDGYLEEIDEICEEVRKGYVSNEDFEYSFINWNGSPSVKDTIQYIFRKINSLLNEYQELTFNNVLVNIEHIMPVVFQEYWPETIDYHDDYLWHLGNLTLLSGKINKGIQNKPFIEKKEEYKLSDIKLNEKLLEYESWNKQTIIDRQKYLASLALKIWNK